MFGDSFSHLKKMHQRKIIIGWISVTIFGSIFKLFENYINRKDKLEATTILRKNINDLRNRIIIQKPDQEILEKILENKKEFIKQFSQFDLTDDIQPTLDIFYQTIDLLVNQDKVQTLTDHWEK